MIQEMSRLTLTNGQKLVGLLSGYDRGTDSYLVRKEDNTITMVALDQIKKREYVLVEVRVNPNL